MSMRIALIAAATAAALAACSQKAPETAAPKISQEVFDLTPGSIKVKAGIVGGELKDLKVTEQVQEGTGQVDSGPRLSGHLVLRNLSTDQSVLVNGGKLVFADAANKPITSGPESNPPAISLGDSGDNSGASRLDPGQELTRDIDVDFPGEALKPGKLHEIRMQLQYTAAPFKRDLMEFPVAQIKKES